MMQEKEFYSPKEIAEKLGISLPRVYIYIKEGKLKAHKLGTAKASPVRISHESFQAFLDDSVIGKKETPGEIPGYEQETFDTLLCV